MALWDHADPDGDGVFDDLYFYLHDRLGSVRQVIDESAAVMHYYTYGPYGELLESVSALNAPSVQLLPLHRPEAKHAHMKHRSKHMSNEKTAPVNLGRTEY